MTLELFPLGGLGRPDDVPRWTYPQATATKHLGTRGSRSSTTPELERSRRGAAHLHGGAPLEPCPAHSEL
jgi:hypothetical protein